MSTMSHIYQQTPVPRDAAPGQPCSPPLKRLAHRLPDIAAIIAPGLRRPDAKADGAIAFRETQLPK